MALTANNMLSSGVSLATDQASSILVNSGGSLTTGKNVNIDVSSFFISNNLNDSVTIGKNVLESMSYGSNAVKTGLGSLDSMVSTLTSMINTVNQSGNLTGNPTALASLNTILAGNLTTLNQQITNTNFNGTSLFTGGLGNNSTLTPKYNVTAVNTRTAANVAGFGGTAGQNGLAAGTSIAISNLANLSNGDQIVIGDATFTLVNTVPDNSGTQIQIATTTDQTAENIATAIKNSSVPSLQAYDITVNKAATTLGGGAAVAATTFSTVSLTARSISANNFGIQFVPATNNIGITTANNRIGTTVTLATAPPVAGDAVTVGGVTFTFAVAAANQNQVTIGTLNASATALYNAILAHPVTANLISTGNLVVSIATPVLTIYQNSGVAPVASFATAANGVAANAAVPVASYVPAIDLSGIRNITNFIGSGLNATVTINQYASSAAGNNAAALLMTNNGYLATGAAGNGDAAAILSINVAGKVFTGGIFLANAGNLNGASFVFTDKTTGEYITINAAAAFAPVMTSQGAVQTNVATPLTTLLNNSIYSQTRDLTNNTTSGNVIVNGTAVASMTGMTAELNTTNFNNLQFTNFQITSDFAGNITFTATTKNTSTNANVNYTLTIPASSVPNLVQGYSLKLISNSGNNDVLTLNLGQLGLVNLNQAVNLAPVATAILNSLTNAGSGLNVRAGVAFSDVLVVKMPNVALNQIMVDGNGNYVPSFDVTSPTGQATANTVLTNALAAVRNAQVGLKSSGGAIDQATNALQNLIQITQDAADSFTDADLIATAEDFSKALKSLSSAILVLKGGSIIASQTQQVIANVVNG